MTNTYEISKEQEAEVHELVAKSYASRFGIPIEKIRTGYFGITSHPTKSFIIGVNVSVEGGTDKDYRPSCVFKKYDPDSQRASDHQGLPAEDVRREYGREAAILEFGIEHPTRHIRPYPEPYHKYVPECRDRMVIIREFVPEEDKLVSIAGKQLKEEGKIIWAATGRSKLISDFVYALAMQHISSEVLAKYLMRQGLLDKMPGEVDPLDIAITEERKYMNRLERLLRGAGRSMEEGRKTRIRELLRPVFAQYSGDKRLQVLINGDLDVVPDNVAYNRILDAGAEVGAFTRDVAVYGDPFFKSLWTSDGKERPAELVKTTIPFYTDVFNMLAEELGYKSEKEKPPEELKGLSLLLSVANGSFRAAASTENYKFERGDGFDKEKIEEEIRNYLINYFSFHNAFGDEIGGKTKSQVREILGLVREGLGEPEKYTISNPNNANHNTKKTLWGIMKATALTRIPPRKTEGTTKVANPA